MSGNSPKKREKFQRNRNDKETVTIKDIGMDEDRFDGRREMEGWPTANTTPRKMLTKVIRRNRTRAQGIRAILQKKWKKKTITRGKRGGQEIAKERQEEIWQHRMERLKATLKGHFPCKYYRIYCADNETDPYTHTNTHTNIHINWCILFAARSFGKCVANI